MVNQFSVMTQQVYQKNPPDCTISTISISVNELFLKFLQGLKNVDQLAMIYAEN